MFRLHSRRPGQGSPALRDFRRLLDALPDAVVIVRPDAPVFTIVAASDAYLRATLTRRHGRGGIIGRGLFEAFPGPPAEHGDAGRMNLRASIERAVALRSQDAMPIQKYDIQRPDGAWEERYWSPVNVPVLDADGAVDYVIHRVEDVTMLMQLRVRMAAAEQATAVAEEANATKARFLAAMSHELRTPLNAIGGYVELLEMGIHGPVTIEQRVTLERVRRSEQHLLGLINEVLSYAKLESGHLELERECLTLREIIDDVMSLIAPQAGAKAVSVQPGPTMIAGCELEVYADADRVRQILLNLVTNAIKFTPPGGIVRVDCHESGDEVAVKVSDSGEGIPIDELERIFEPFVQIGTAETMREGTGLGLPISRNLARAMGGDITVVSNTGRGSIFTLALPRRRGERRRSA